MMGRNLQQIAQNGSNGHRNNQSRLNEFQRTSPPVFSHSAEPLDADDWLRTIEKKLKVARCEDGDKVLFATQYLHGPAAAWWEDFSSTQPKDEDITWDSFKDNFRKHHIPAGLIGIKKQEFLTLKQGNMTVAEYVHKFTQLSRYAREDLTTEDAKIEKFMRGLQQILQCQLATHDFTSLQKLVDKAIILEDRRRALVDTRKRKKDRQYPSEGSHKHPRLGKQHTSRNATPRFNKTITPMYHSNTQNVQSFQKPRINNFPPAGPSKNANNPNCWNCGEPGHFSSNCPRKHQGAPS
jgi:hypothetical protein